VEEKKPTRIPLVAASETGRAQAFNPEAAKKKKGFLFFFFARIASRIVVSERDVRVRSPLSGPSPLERGIEEGDNPVRGFRDESRRRALSGPKRKGNLSSRVSSARVVGVRLAERDCESRASSFS